MLWGFSVRDIRAVSISIVGAFLALFQSHPVWAEIRLQGAAEDIRLEAHDATIEEILAALHQRYDLRYRGTTLNRRITATYEGSLRKILLHVLDGYDYVIGPMGSNIEVIVLSTGTPRQAVAPVPLVHHRSD
jgi:hypothetical protein